MTASAAMRRRVSWSVQRWWMAPKRSKHRASRSRPRAVGFDEHLAEVRGGGTGGGGVRAGRASLAGASEGEFHQRAVAHAPVEVRVELHLGQRATRGREPSRARSRGSSVGSSADASATSAACSGTYPTPRGTSPASTIVRVDAPALVPWVRRGDVAPRRRHLAVAPQRDRQTLLETEVVAPNLVRASVVKRVSGRGGRRGIAAKRRRGFRHLGTPEGGGNQPRRQSTMREE